MTLPPYSMGPSGGRWADGWGDKPHVSDTQRLHDEVAGLREKVYEVERGVLNLYLWVQGLILAVVALATVLIVQALR